MWRSGDEQGDASGISDADDDPMSGGDNDAMTAPAPETSATVAPPAEHALPPCLAVHEEAAARVACMVAELPALLAAMSAYAASREQGNDTRLSQLEASKAAAELL